MIFGIDINSFFSSYGTTLDGIASLIAIIGFVGGCVSAVYGRIAKKSAKKAEKIAEESEKKIKESEAKIKEYETRIEKIETDNAQIAHIIYNNGLSYKDTKDIVTEVVDEKTKNKPEFFIIKNGIKESANELSFIVQEEEEQD